MATRAPQKTQILTAAQALAFVARHGAVAESARRGAVPSLAEAIAGDVLNGGWWSHPRRREIFALTRQVRDSPHVLVCRVVDGKISFVHERVWPALVRVAGDFPQARLARVSERHSASGKHVLDELPFPHWVPAAVTAAAAQLSQSDARSQLHALLSLAQK